MSALFFFSSLILSCFCQTQVEDFECCNNCQDIGPATCSAPFYWRDHICDQFEQPFWPYNFCPNNPTGESCLRGNCHCTEGDDAIRDSTGQPTGQVRTGNICVRSLPDEENAFGAWGTWLCDNSKQCDADNVCPENHYCVDTCCGDNRRRCVPCCNEPLKTVPTPDPTKDPVPSPTGDPTRNPVRKPTDDPTRNPVPTPQQECPCEFPQGCISPFTWQQECQTTPWIQQDLIQCPATGQEFTIWSQCRCTFDWTDNQPSDLIGVCIKDPFSDNMDQRMCACAQVCQPGDPTQGCPNNHYCVQTCCDQLNPDFPRYHCVPCCDTPWIIQ